MSGYSEGELVFATYGRKGLDFSRLFKKDTK